MIKNNFVLLHSNLDFSNDDLDQFCDEVDGCTCGYCDSKGNLLNINLLRAKLLFESENFITIVNNKKQIDSIQIKLEYVYDPKKSARFSTDNFNLLFLDLSVVDGLGGWNEYYWSFHDKETFEEFLMKENFSKEDVEMLDNKGNGHLNMLFSSLLTTLKIAHSVSIG